MTRRNPEMHMIKGGKGIGLNVQISGKPDGKPILFLHGFSQSRLVWNKQIDSDLSDDFLLVALDLRGHGLSEKHADIYGDPGAWADDVNAVITTLGLELPVLVGWSYAGIVISDYVSRYGEHQIAGTNWVGAVSRLGDPLVGPGFLGERFLSCVPGFFSEKVEESITALEAFVRACVHGEAKPEDHCFFLGCAVIVPPHVRQSLLSRNVNNDSVIAGMRKPMVLSYGDADAVALNAMRDHMVELVKDADAQLSVYDEVGHAPFWEADVRFNVELRQFRQTV